MSGLHIFDTHLEAAHRWVKEIMTQLQLRTDDQGRALSALRAGLHAIRDRLPASEVLDLGAQLPTLIRGIYFDGWTLQNDPRRMRTRASMLQRVEDELPPSETLDPEDVLRAVIHLLVAHISRGEIDDVITTLPRAIAALWQT